MNSAIVINLDSRREQFEEVRRSFNPYSISCERFSAIEHEEGFVGCALSHLKIIEEAKKNHWPWVMVLEDDCVAREAMKDWPEISRFLMQQKDRWDVFIGGTTYLQPIKCEQDFHRSQPRRIDLVECRDVHATHFIIYNKSSYECLLAWHDLPQLPEQRDPIDVFIQKCSLRTWVPSPFIAWQKVHYSAIQKKVVNYDAAFQEAEHYLDYFALLTALSFYSQKTYN